MALIFTFLRTFFGAVFLYTFLKISKNYEFIKTIKIIIDRKKIIIALHPNCVFVLLFILSKFQKSALALA